MKPYPPCRANTAAAPLHNPAPDPRGHMHADRRPQGYAPAAPFRAQSQEQLADVKADVSSMIDNLAKAQPLIPTRCARAQSPCISLPLLLPEARA